MEEKTQSKEKVFIPSLVGSIACFVMLIVCLVGTGRTAANVVGAFALQEILSLFAIDISFVASIVVSIIAILLVVALTVLNIVHLVYVLADRKNYAKHRLFQMINSIGSVVTCGMAYLGSFLLSCKIAEAVGMFIRTNVSAILKLIPFDGIGAYVEQITEKVVTSDMVTSLASLLTQMAGEKIGDYLDSFTSAWIKWNFNISALRDLGIAAILTVGVIIITYTWCKTAIPVETKEALPEAEETK